MSDYYYSQRYGGYKDEVIIPGPTMGEKGCLITVFAMILSYFNNSAYFPEQMLHWLHKHNGMTSDGRLYWQKLCEAAGGNLRMAIKPNPKPGEVTYGIHECKVSGQQHFVLDHPSQVGKIIDPWDGRVKPYNSQEYTNRDIYYMGKK